MLEKLSQSKISRRNFLKGSTFVLAGLSTGIGAASFKAFAQGESVDSNDSVWKSSFCAGCHLPVCATKVKVVNGVLVEVQGDPNSESNQGHLCPRGMTFPYNIYNPYRVKAPMKRTNPEKGLDQDPQWVEISWDEAINTVVEKLKEVRNTDPRSLLIMPGFGFEEGFMTFEIPFSVGFGTPNLIETPGMLCPEHFAGLHYNGHMLDRIDLEYVKYLVVVGRNFGADWVASSGHTLHYAEALEKGLHVVNVNPVSRTSAHKGEWVPILPGTDTAFGLALIYTILYEIGKYDEWFLKVRSNAPYLIEDKPTIIKDTLVYQEDYVRDPETGKPLVWDEVKNSAVPFDSSKGESYALTGTYTVNGKEVKPTFQLLKDYVVNYTPEWAEKITTIPAAKIREIANNLIKEANIGATIDIDGFTFPHRGAAIYTGRGCSTNMLGCEAYKALGTVNLLLGNYDVPGGMLGTESASWATLKADKDGELKASNFFYTQVVGAPFEFPPQRLDMEGLYPMKHNTVYFIWKAIMEPEKYYIEYPVKAMMLHGANPITSNANCETTVEALKKIDFIFSIAYHFDEPTQFCDILLPEHHSVERVGMYRYRWNQKEATNQNRGLYGTLIKKPAVEPTYNTRQAEDIMMEIAKKVGFLPAMNNFLSHAEFFTSISKDMPQALAPQYFLDPEKQYTYEEIVERKIKSDYGPESGYQDFEECAFKPHRLSLKESYNYYFVPENQIRLPLYFNSINQNIKELMANLEKYNTTVPNQDMEHFKRHYCGLPMWYESITYGTTPEYPFKLVNWKIHYVVNNSGDHAENPLLHETINTFSPKYKKVWINTATAQELGLKEDDEIIIESQFGGKTKGKLHLTNLIHPSCIGIPGNYGRKGMLMNPASHEGAHYNVLIGSDESNINPVMGNIDNSPRVKIYKA